MASPEENLAKNAKYIKQGTASFKTPLDSLTQLGFQQWVKDNNVPYDPSISSDYDMQGFYKGLISGDPAATTGVNPNDKKLHFSDKWKTPYHDSFSNESQYADKDKAPAWNDKDQLVTPGGKIVYDERNKDQGFLPNIKDSLTSTIENLVSASFGDK